MLSHANVLWGPTYLAASNSRKTPTTAPRSKIATCEHILFLRNLPNGSMITPLSHYDFQRLYGARRTWKRMSMCPNSNPNQRFDCFASSFVVVLLGTHSVLLRNDRWSSFGMEYRVYWGLVCLRGNSLIFVSNCLFVFSLDRRNAKSACDVSFVASIRKSRLRVWTDPGFFGICSTVVGMTTSIHRLLNNQKLVGPLDSRFVKPRYIIESSHPTSTDHVP